MDIPLSEAVVVDDKPIARVTLSRPKTRHVKKLVLLLGPDFFSDIIDLAGGKDSAAEDLTEEGKEDSAAEGLTEERKKAIAAKIVGSLLTAEAFEGLTELIADLSGLTPEAVDDLDPVDLVKIGQGLAELFPKALPFFDGGKS